jgi:plasmid stabilization system protein ParE
MKRVRIRSEAQEEINEAFDWYFKRNPDVAGAFLNEIGFSLAQIVLIPKCIHRIQRTHAAAYWLGFPIQ